MLPGFRFLFVAIVLSISVLVFGLGAAALLRAAHEEFASTPSWHAAPEPVFAQQSEAARPVLAMLRFEPPAEQKASDDVAARAAPDAAPEEQAAIDPAAAEPEKVAALTVEESSPPQMAKPEIPASETPARSEAAPDATDAPDTVSETKIAAIEEVLPAAKEILPPASDAGPIASEQASPPAIPDADAASTKIATLGDAPLAVDTPPAAKPASAKPDKSVIKKRRQARQAARRRRIAQRAQLAQQALQQPNNPFAQPVTPDRRR